MPKKALRIGVYGYDVRNKKKDVSCARQVIRQALAIVIGLYADPDTDIIITTSLPNDPGSISLLVYQEARRHEWHVVGIDGDSTPKERRLPVDKTLLLYGVRWEDVFLENIDVLVAVTHGYHRLEGLVSEAKRRGKPVITRPLPSVGLPDHTGIARLVQRCGDTGIQFQPTHRRDTYSPVHTLCKILCFMYNKR